MSQRAYVGLEPWQVAQLSELFLMVNEANARGEQCGIVAQVFKDGISAKFITGDKAQALAKELGGKFSEATAYSAKDHFESGFQRDRIEQWQA